MKRIHVMVVAACATALIASGAPVTAIADEPTVTPAACTYPAEILDLRNWKETLPIDDPNQSGSQPLEIRQPQLATYAIDPWFKVNSACDGVQFRSAVNGVTTPNSSYARSELREMTNNGSSNASWSSTSGTHTMVIQQAITNLPSTKPHVVAGQIHDGSDDRAVFRLEGNSLYVTNGDNTHHKLVTSNYVLGTRFEAKFVVSGGQIKAYYNGVLQTTISASFSGGYFKAGAYTQANCSNSSPCSSSNYGQVIVYGLTVSHGTTTPPPTPGNPLPVCAVTASGDDGNVPANTLDNNLSTRWSDEGDGVWIRFDLCNTVSVGSVSIAWHRGDVRRTSFKVDTSTDGSSWSSALSTRDSSGSTLQPELHDFSDRSARYLRITGYGNTDNEWTSITEVDVFAP